MSQFCEQEVLSDKDTDKNCEILFLLSPLEWNLVDFESETEMLHSIRVKTMNFRYLYQDIKHENESKEDLLCQNQTYISKQREES